MIRQDDVTYAGGSRNRPQINVRMDPPSLRALRAIARHTGEMYSVLIRRLIREEAARLDK